MRGPRTTYINSFRFATRPLRLQGPEEWRQYPREAIPPLFGLAYNAPVWNQGFIFKNNRVVLLVTLDKSTQAKEHRYEDHFEAPDRFQWQSQNKQHRARRHRAEAGPTR